MYDRLGSVIVRFAPVWIAGWLLVWLASETAAPAWRDVAQDREFAFLPADAPSRVGESVFARAFPEEQLGSSIVLVLRHPQEQRGFAAADKHFADTVLEPALRQIAEAEGGLAVTAVTEDSPFDAPAKPADRQPSIIARIRTPSAPGTGSLLVSEDGRAWVVLIELTTDFQAHRNLATIEKIENLVQTLHSEGKVPAGLQIHLAGSAVIGRDQIAAQIASTNATERWTIILVVGLLILIYRAPLLTLIPLLTVFVAVRIAINLIALLAGAGYVTVFEGIQIYITIVSYGAGVDYCLFLTARYREELDQSGDVTTAMRRAIGNVGGALTASAATVMGGIGMMVFAQFGKFHQAGIVMPLSLLIVLLATLTFAASLIHVCGRWALWPYYRPSAHLANGSAKRPASYMERQWIRLAALLTRRPGLLGLAAAGLMAPFAGAGLLLQRQQSYDIISSLPASAPSVRGTRALQEHFDPGLMGPVTVLLVEPSLDFAAPAGEQHIETLTANLEQRRQELGLADVRTLTAPLGISDSARQAMAREGLTREKMPEVLRQELISYYTTDFGERRKIGTRLDLILSDPLFSRDSLDRLTPLQAGLRTALPAELRAADLYLVGPTVSLRDLRAVNNSDQVRIEILVLAVVFFILWILLRGLLVSLYLILSVLFSYYATLGVTIALFWLLDPAGFAGLDWKVSIFLFTILIAVGEDYNIFLMTRVAEEQERHGRIRGVARAVIKTGPIISSCGLIMAGTFASLMMGSLQELQQLGFALSFGVLLDTFVVRPILVPAFLIVLNARKGWEISRIHSGLSSVSASQEAPPLRG